MTHSRVVVIVVALMLSGVPALAAPVGKVMGVRGPVFREAGGKAEVLANGAPLNEADTVVSGPGGKVKLQLNDGTVLSLGENARLRLDEVKAGGGQQSVRLNLRLGPFRIVVPKRLANGHFEVETETAVAAVRGTEFLVDAAQDTVGIALIEGAVAVRGKGQRAPIVVLLDRPGLGTDVATDEAPNTPNVWSGERLARLLARTGID
jgi:hypothetical protein